MAAGHGVDRPTGDWDDSPNATLNLDRTVNLR